MFPSPRLTRLVPRAWLPRGTVRLRLTLLYGGLFLISGAALLTITYLLVRHSTGTVVRTPSGMSVEAPVGAQEVPKISGSSPPQALIRQLEAARAHQHASELHQLLVQSGIALAIMTTVSIALGWLVAGRVLRPLRTMTETARAISAHNLGERLALPGPRDELKELGDTIDDLLGRLDAAFEAQRRFVANASHELRTPLTMIRTSVDVATRKPGTVPPQVTALGDKVRKGLDQADRLLESFLMLARAERGALQEQTEVPLVPLVAGSIDSHRDAIADRGVTIRQTLERVEASGSEALLRRMVENLIDNAIRHNEPGGWIRVGTSLNGGDVELDVESGGPRLDEREVRELARPFRRLASDRTRSEDGVGLGLSIVAAIVAAHDGELELHARPEGGLSVTIRLPNGADPRARRDPL
jgi:signal transduction histidine kinase